MEVKVRKCFKREGRRMWKIVEVEEDEDGEVVKGFGKIEVFGDFKRNGFGGMEG